jgi:hypothetical protein
LTYITMNSNVVSSMITAASNFHAEGTPERSRLDKLAAAASLASSEAGDQLIRLSVEDVQLFLKKET